MELYKEILAQVLSRQNIHVSFDNLSINSAEIVESEAYKTLTKIQSIIKDDGFDDAECFHRIEEIINTFEFIGSDGGSRHDFG